MTNSQSSTARGTTADDYSVTQVRRALGETLQGYIEAQYHIRDVSLIRERAKLLTEPCSIAQLPYVEATPVYELFGAKGVSVSVPDVLRVPLDIVVSQDTQANSLPADLQPGDPDPTPSPGRLSTPEDRPVEVSSDPYTSRT